MSIAFLLTSLIVVVTPGTGVVYTLTAALGHGRRAGLVAAVACMFGVAPHVLASATGLAALLHASPVAFEVVKYLGVAYLLYMAVATLRDRDAMVVAGDTGPWSARRLVTGGILSNVLNPKLTMFFVAFLPQFTTSGSVAELLYLGGVFMALTLLVFIGYGLFAAAVRHRVTGSPRVLAWVRRVLSASFVALGARLALAAR